VRLLVFQVQKADHPGKETEVETLKESNYGIK
jgi:hypothetical protein